MLSDLRALWAPEAFVVSFKLETDEGLLMKKVRPLQAAGPAALSASPWRGVPRVAYRHKSIIRPVVAKERAYPVLPGAMGWASRVCIVNTLAVVHKSVSYWARVAQGLTDSQRPATAQASNALERYSVHAVVANILSTRKDVVTLVTPAADGAGHPAAVSQMRRPASGQVIEAPLVAELARLHGVYRGAAGRA